MVIIIVIALVSGVIIWWLNARQFEGTDDAFIDSHIVHVAPQIAGQVIALDVTDNQLVRRGQVVAELGPQDEAARLAQVQAQGAQAETQLQQALAGQTGAPLPAIPASLPVGLPSDLLRRRPDVREAERQLAQATAKEGVAIAALYPKFNLIGAINLASNSLGSLFNSSSLNEVGVGMISWPLFSGGKGHANIRAKQEEEQQAYFAYQKAVLGAVQDCEDALVRYAAEQRRFVTLQEAVARDQSSFTIAAQQYQVGLTNYVNVLTAESNQLQASDQLAQSKQALAGDLASIYKSVGWRLAGRGRRRNARAGSR